MFQKSLFAIIIASYIKKVSGLSYSNSSKYRLWFVCAIVLSLTWLSSLTFFILQFIKSTSKYLSDKELVEANADSDRWEWQRSLSWFDGQYFNPLDTSNNERAKIFLENSADYLMYDTILLVFLILTPFLIILLGKLLRWIFCSKIVQNIVDPLKEHAIDLNKTKGSLYFLVEDGKQSKPYTFEQLREMRLRENELVWCIGMIDWKPIKEVAELKGIIFYTPHPIAPPVPNTFSEGKRKLLFKIVFSVGVLLFLSVIILNVVNSKNYEAKSDIINEGESISIDNEEQIANDVVVDNPSEKEVVARKTDKNQAMTNMEDLPFENYYLSDDGTSLNYFDEVESYWWFRRAYPLGDAYSDYTVAVPDFTDKDRKDKSFKASDYDWNIADIKNIVEELNIKHNKNGKVYVRKHKKGAKFDFTPFE